MNLIRGGGLEAVGGIWPETRHGRSALAQPLLDVERAEVEAFCRALHLRPRVDPTNRDTRQLRNAVRLRVIPAIERATGREVKRPIARDPPTCCARIGGSWTHPPCTRSRTS